MIRTGYEQIVQDVARLSGLFPFAVRIMGAVVIIVALALACRIIAPAQLVLEVAYAKGMHLGYVAGESQALTDTNAALNQMEDQVRALKRELIFERSLRPKHRAHLRQGGEK